MTRQLSPKKRDRSDTETPMTHPMSEPWLQWIPYDGRIETNDEFVLVLLSRSGPSGRIQGCKVKNGKPFVIGGIFAWDYGETPTHWARYPDVPATVEHAEPSK